jgi:hypothetical protein
MRGTGEIAPQLAPGWAALAREWAGAADRLRRLCQDPEAVQRTFLQQLIASNAASRFGRDHGFGGLHTYADFAEAVPVAPYEGFRPYIDRLTQGAPAELTQDPVLFVEMTGGSTGGSKIVPYTRSALAAYARALQPWLADLIERFPRVAAGRIYFSLSPAGRTGDETVGTLPLGSPEQFEYFGPGGAHLSALSIAPLALASLSDFDSWQFATCLHLLAAEDLAFVWVWSPTYFSELLHAIRRLKAPLLAALADGGDPGLPLPPPDPARAATLDALIGDETLDTAAIWPNLSIVSCWMDASSAPFAAELQHALPHAAFQAKGLMATEGATTLPFGDGPGAPLALASAFFEFVAEDGAISLAHQLREGEVRRVVVSNHCGFYRYDTEDLVEVVGFEGRTPRLRFVGRAGQASDLCGEKLSEQFVLNCLHEALAGPEQYGFLAPAAAGPARYILWFDPLGGSGAAAEVAAAMDRALCANPQYAYARRLGQLGPVAACPAADLYDRYSGWALARGRNLGHLKAPALLRDMPPDLRLLLMAPHR